MDKSKIKEILIKWREGEREGYKSTSYRRVFASLKRMVRSDREGLLENGKWLYDNFYLFDESMAELRGKKISRDMRAVSRLLVRIMRESEVSDGVSAFFETMADFTVDEDIDGIREALLAETMVIVREELLEKSDVSVGINLLRRIREFDFTPFFLGYFSYEQYLRRDPEGIYPRLDKESKSLYKKKIREYAKKRGISFTDASERLILEAERKKCHVGELLGFNSPPKRWWILYPLIFIFLMALAVDIVFNGRMAFLPSVITVLLLVLPIKEVSFMLFGTVVSRLLRAEILPRLDMPRISEENATLTVVASLISDEEEARKIFTHLENISLKSRSRGKDDRFLYYGVLCDLPESLERTTKRDEKIIRAAKKEVDRLNKEYEGRFILFTREKKESEGKFIARERKRGAIEELVKLLRGMESELEGYGASLPKIKYVLTLDSDTDIELGGINKMVGTMAHPLNRPIISERRGVKVVEKGYGVLAPTIFVSLESAHATRFSSMMTGVGGTDSYHGAVFNLWHAVFGKGIFCGKGMFDVDAFKETLIDAFPDGMILSHDILEGTRLSSGHLSDVVFFDSIPSGVRSYYNRAHRWARGDVQSLRFVLPRVPTKKGYARNPMTGDERFLFINNALNLLLPIAETLGLFALMRYDSERLTLVAALILSPIFLPFLFSLFSSLFSGRLKTLVRRFFGDTLSTLYRETVLLGYRLSALAFEAYTNADAIIRALWRMTVSKKRLLEWTTASASEREKSAFPVLLRYTFPSFLFGAFALLFARLSIVKLVGILWCLYPIIAAVLSSKREVQRKGKSYRSLFERYAFDIWRYFDKYVDSANNFLPPDNVSVFPSSEIAKRTSPTNIGLYLLSVLAALDFGFISVVNAVDRLENTLSAIEKLPKYKGQLYNWYSTVNLEVIGKEYISTVDCGNFISCLVALYEGLYEYEGADKRIKELREQIKKIEIASDFKFLYNPKRELFSLGYFPDKEEQDTIVYDMYMSEARITDYYAIARGVVKESHWSYLARPLSATKYGVGALSWSGTAFEFFMPHLLLPVYKNSFAHEALNFAFIEQMNYSASIGRERVYGISESGYYAFDEALNYQYRAFGVPSLSRSRESGNDMVVSPYSSFLMLRANTPLNVKNLKSLERLGMYGECGFYEALDLTGKRVGKTPSMVKSFMCHHLGMSMVALANATFDDVFVRRFMKDKEMNAVSELLRESVPVDAVSFKTKSTTGKRKREITPFKEKIRSERVFRTAPDVGVLSGRDHTMLLFERGIVSEEVKLSSGEEISTFNPLTEMNPTGLFLFATDEERVFSPSVSNDVSFNFDPAFAEYRMEGLRATVSLSAKTSATRIRLQATGRRGEVGIYLEPILTRLTSYLAHPSYVGIFFKAEYDEESSLLILSFSGKENVYLALTCSSDFTFEVSRLSLFKEREYSVRELAEAVKKPLTNSLSTETPLSPCVLAKCGYTSSTDTTFVIGYGRTKAGAIYAARDEKTTSFYNSIERNLELYRGALTAVGGLSKINRELYGALLSVFRPEYRWKMKKDDAKIYSKDKIYSLGLSGDLPIFLVRSGVKKEILSEIIKYKKLQYIMGVRYDLVIEVVDTGYSRGGLASLEEIIDREESRFMLNKKGGVFFLDVSDIDTHMAIETVAAASYPEKERLVKHYRTPAYSKRRSSVAAAEKAGFISDGYVINNDERPPEVLWSHVIASEAFGTMLTHRSLGNTWVFNSRLSRITFWENDAVGGGAGEKVILSEKNFERDLCLSANTVRFTMGGGEYIGDGYSIRVAIHPKLLFKAVSVRVEREDFSLLYKFIPVMDDFPRPSTVIEYWREGKNVCMFHNSFSDSLKKGFGYLYLPYEKEIGINDMRVEVSCYKPGDTVFVLGYAGSDRHFSEVKKYFSEHSFRELALLSEEFFKEKIARASFHSSIGVKLSDFWLPYQTLVSRFFARSGPYQSGGAWGFRDQAQDCLSVIDMDIERVRNHIFRMARHQYTEGDVQHWWHYSKGIRTRCSDDYLWLVWLTTLYIKRTKDKSILGKEIYYLESPPLSEKERDRYETYKRSDVRESLHMHLKRALSLAIERGVGAHNLPFIGDGDWNDGLNGLPTGTESVWLAFFMRIVIGFYLENIEDCDEYRKFSELLRKGIEENAFFSDRYARAFLPDGRVLGVSDSDSMKIDALPEAFASISHAILGDGNPSRITLALDSAWRELYDEKVGIYRLFVPPFREYDENIGYISAYPEGVRENSAEYTHGAVWGAIGFLLAPEKKEENLKRAKTLARLFDSSERGEEYKIEPYVMAGDVYSNPSNPGRGGWSWYTGSASWYRFLLMLLDDEKRNNSDSFS